MVENHESNDKVFTVRGLSNDIKNVNRLLNETSKQRLLEDSHQDVSSKAKISDQGYLIAYEKCQWAKIALCQPGRS